ncbi:hypothetical protein CGRA01v4_09931 [Colletotrichum graminicola]|uniref:NmrA-like domain-containing protein n=1 Tax=Colletotrichum graminicola (strain M1.001 / M2 / FGSC 10212) TaxID=645133 RepID=E3QHQ4_COLGM|nr:uncharacterized protein GLRG_05536 [Colletotrichum graminicola M1.001]EFQ30392.1 hypothetical protein GLRG_05536 [Colletotrichum graminicola M1.001]WDK18646.1 hypothetical protein CGRA01v4_09931 [Colletotrichum graminicola]
MSSTRIALAGATGHLGVPLLQALLDANFLVTVLSRKGGSNAAKLAVHPNLDVQKVDFRSMESLRPALVGVELAKGALADVDGAMLGLCICGATSSDYGCDFSDRLDNELLGIEKMDEKKLRALIASFLG